MARRSPARDGHSSGTPVARRLKQPTRAADRTTDLSDRSPRRSYSVLLPVGFAMPPAVAGSAVRSYRTVSPLPAYAERKAGGLLLCGTFPGVAPAGRYPAPLSMEPGLSSPAAFRQLPERPSGRLTLLEWAMQAPCVKALALRR